MDNIVPCECGYYNKLAVHMCQGKFSPGHYAPTRREYFAAAALTGLMAVREDDLHEIAEEAVCTADAIIAELDKEPK